MTNLENGTASEGPVATVKAESLGNCHKCNLPIEGYDSACSVSNLNYLVLHEFHFRRLENSVIR